MRLTAMVVLLFCALGIFAVFAAEQPTIWRKTVTRVYPTKPEEAAIQLASACDLSHFLADDLKTARISKDARSDLQTLQGLVCGKAK